MRPRFEGGGGEGIIKIVGDKFEKSVSKCMASNFPNGMYDAM